MLLSLAQIYSQEKKNDRSPLELCSVHEIIKKGYRRETKNKNHCKFNQLQKKKLHN